tara:strand:- start:8741 stop:8935 length:195 start_codon:yes stop_codon:yes gene_type:complete
MKKEELEKLRESMINATSGYEYPEGTNSYIIVELLDHIDILKKFLTESRRQSDAYFNQLQELKK